MHYVAIRSEGNLIPYDVLDKIAAEDMAGQKPADFGLPKGRRLVDEMSRVWADAQNLWSNFKRRRQSLTDSSGSANARDPYGTSITRTWIMSLFSDPEMLGYELKLLTNAVIVNNVSFAISHRNGETDDAVPVHIEGCRIDLDRRLNTKLRTSPQAMLQDFLNNSEPVLWGIVTNGLTVRLLRDSSRTSRPTYLEFDLESIFEGNRFNEFALFYRLLHRSRFPQTGKEPADCLLEKYYQDSIEQGLRIRDKLRDGVEDALKTLGTAFLQHPNNQALRERYASGKLTAEKYHRQLLLLVYRLLFLMVAEERKLIVSQGENAERNQKIYSEWYSIARLRDRAARIVEATPYADLWAGLKQTFSLFEYGTDQNALGIPPLNGDLFDETRAIPDLAGTELYNHELLLAVRRLSLFKIGNSFQRVNYSALDVEELGSVYESLLDFKPVIIPGDQGLTFDLRVGMERKSTGSYYTRPELVHELIESALVPVMEDRLTEAEKAATGLDLVRERAMKEQALLNMTVCDPACGSGHFLLAAARRLGKELARVRTGEDEPRPEEFHLAVRDAISHCIYGVDLNPLAVDLCKLSLWLEGHWIAKPLSFLDHRLKCGNSLVGVLGPSVLNVGIPDEAFTPVAGDDKKVARAFKKRNQEERAGQPSLPFEVAHHISEYAGESHRLSDIREETAAGVRQKARAYESWRGQDWWHDWTTCNIWTAAFFVPLKDILDPTVPTYERLLRFIRRQDSQPHMAAAANAMAERLRFFHWRLEFPEVFEKSGFDVVLGNPPWERITLREDEHWIDDPYIDAAQNKAERGQRIKEYRASEDQRIVQRLARFDNSKHDAEALSDFIRHSRRFVLTGTGDFNTYALFSELAYCTLSTKGRAGIVTPTGIVTDDTTKLFFAEMVNKQRLIKVLGFINEEGIFPGVLHNFKFCALTFCGPESKAHEADFAFFCYNFDEARELERHFRLTNADLRLLNPITATCPVFRTSADALFNKKLYTNTPILASSSRDSSWQITFMRMFDMALDSESFSDSPHADFLPLYEAKMIHQFDHRFASHETLVDRRRMHMLPQVTDVQHADPYYSPQPCYFVPIGDVKARIGAEWNQKWLLALRRISSNALERTVICAVVPLIGTSDSITLIRPEKSHAMEACCLVANLNALVFDYATRQKAAGSNLSVFVLKQLPVLLPGDYTSADFDFIVPRVLSLVYTSYDLQEFVADVARVYPIPMPAMPYAWDPVNRLHYRAELDGYYSHLYGLTRDELRYLLDPKEVFGADFPGETFRVLREREEKEFGEYRTRRLVLEAFDKLAETPRFRNEMASRRSAFEVPAVRQSPQ